MRSHKHKFHTTLKICRLQLRSRLIVICYFKIQERGRHPSYFNVLRLNPTIALCVLFDHCPSVTGYCILFDFQIKLLESYLLIIYFTMLGFKSTFVHVFLSLYFNYLVKHQCYKSAFCLISFTNQRSV